MCKDYLTSVVEIGNIISDYHHGMHIRSYIHVYYVHVRM